MPKLKPIELVEHKKYKDMFYLKFSNGKLSEEFYNLPRAKDALINYNKEPVR